MFKFLSSTGPERTVNIANQAIRLIEWRSMLPDDLSENGVWLSDELSADERRLTLRVVKEIEKTEKTSFSSLSEVVANKYLLKLSDIANNRISKTLSPVDIKNGRRILQMWKYARPPVEERHPILRGKLSAEYIEAKRPVKKVPGIPIRLTFNKDKDRELQVAVTEREQRLKGLKMKSLHLYTPAQLKRAALQLERRLFKTNTNTTQGVNKHQTQQSLKRIKSAIRQRTKEGEAKKD
jgi:hypothetical protein